MSATIAVTGAGGRVGGAICAHLESRFDVRGVARDHDEEREAFARRAVIDAHVVVNAAGVAHVRDDTPSTLARLEEGNVDLPAAVARAALDVGASMIHISSVKASTDDDRSIYADSKRRGDDRLIREFGRKYELADRCLIIVRPLALLIPPFEAGRLSRLTALPRWPRPLTPPIPLPALTATKFLAVIETLVDDALARRTSGVSVREFTRGDRANLREVRDAVSAAQRGTSS